TLNNLGIWTSGSPQFREVMVRNVNWEDEVRMDIGDAADNVIESLTRGDDMKSVLKTLELLINGAKQFFNKEEIAFENVINEIVKKYWTLKKVNKVQKKENEDVSDNEDTKSVMTKKSKKQENVKKY
ncbi:MAG: hypothetical protein EZS28_056316, partial [Streblomastix strix]